MTDAATPNGNIPFGEKRKTNAYKVDYPGSARLFSPDAALHSGDRTAQRLGTIHYTGWAA